MEFGDKIKELRTKNQLTQEQFAMRLNVTRQAVSNWENNRNLPDLEMIILISSVFHISIDELILGGNNMNNMTEKLIKDGNKTRRVRLNLVTTLIGTFLLFFGFACELILGGNNMNNMTEKLIKDGNKTRRVRLNLVTTLIGTFLLFFGFACFFIKANSVEYIDASGILHENFYLLPIGVLFILAGMIVFMVTGAKFIIDVIRNRKDSRQENN